MGWVHRHPALDAGSSKLRNNTGPRLGGRGDGVTLPIRQQTLADLLGCSRRSIYRALKQLKEQGYLAETGKRQNRCKVYAVTGDEVSEGRGLNPLTQFHWELYEKTYRIVFKEPDLFEKYCQVAWYMRNIDDNEILWTKTWAGLYLLYGHSQLRKRFEGLSLEEIAKAEISVAECRT
ncbi:MAG: winged helix-turn-helix domain-containing protein [Deltaproteobacteria bacterium]|nr:winged helix-turn-helix domain-containing protein [Deltaproteobacteria bacterium]